MKESVAMFEARTGLVYRAIGAGVAPGARQPVPTLFRYPGPQGLAAHLQGQAARLAPLEAPFVWLAESARADNAKSVGLFGVVAVLQPLALGVARDGRHWLGENRITTPADALVWLPPGAIKAGLNLDRVAQPEQAIKRCKNYAAEKARVMDTLGGYLEELGALQNAGAPAGGKPWCAWPVGQRRKLLARHGLKGRFTK